jgi:23S rRNA-/tRNA-specific pseudouridylate synthase
MHELNCCTSGLLLFAFADLSLVKLSLYLIKHNAVKTYGGVEV